MTLFPKPLIWLLSLPFMLSLSAHSPPTSLSPVSTLYRLPHSIRSCSFFSSSFFSFSFWFTRSYLYTITSLVPKALDLSSSSPPHSPSPPPIFKNYFYTITSPALKAHYIICSLIFFFFPPPYPSPDAAPDRALVCIHITFAWKSLAPPSAGLACNHTLRYTCHIFRRTYPWGNEFPLLSLMLQNLCNPSSKYGEYCL